MCCSFSLYYSFHGYSFYMHFSFLLFPLHSRYVTSSWYFLTVFFYNALYHWYAVFSQNKIKLLFKFATVVNVSTVKMRYVQSCMRAFDCVCPFTVQCCTAWSLVALAGHCRPLSRAIANSVSPK